MSAFEAAMIICFGISWPVAIWKTLKTRQVHGKSIAFLTLIASGYGFGVLHKTIHAFDWIILLYAFNFVMVLTELGLCLIYGTRRNEEVAHQEATADTLFCDDNALAVSPAQEFVSPAHRYRDTAGGYIQMELFHTNPTSSPPLIATSAGPNSAYNFLSLARTAGDIRIVPRGTAPPANYRISGWASPRPFSRPGLGLHAGAVPSPAT